MVAEKEMKSLVIRLLVAAYNTISASATTFSAFNNYCNIDTFCLPIGNWPGGIGSCIASGKCMCKPGRDECFDDRQCCGGKCTKNLCEFGRLGDICYLDDPKIFWCQPPLECIFNYASDVSVSSYKLGLCFEQHSSTLTSFLSDCNEMTICAPTGSWPGGFGNCFNGKCLCRVKEDCGYDHQCCSGTCTNGVCKPGGDGDVCVPDSCANGLKCKIPSDDYKVAQVFTHGYGSCEGGNVVSSSFSVAAKTSWFGLGCHRGVICDSMGHWPGGLGNCLGGICDCKVGVECSKDRECCSGRCLRIQPNSNGLCALGRLGDICNNKTCDFGFYCQIPSVYRNVQSKYPHTHGTCLETSPYGSACDAESFCQPLSHWPGGKGNCLEGKCACRLGQCESDSQCCSGKCTSGSCELGRLNTMCNQTSCASGLTCGIDTVRWTEAFRQTRGLCMEFSPFGSICNESTWCQSNASWPGGLGNCVNSRCRCEDKNNCERNEQCCSGKCADNKCQPGKKGDLCIDHTMCNSSNLCDIPPRHTIMEAESWGVCTECSALTSSCDSETFCCATSSWPGGRGNCFAGKCHCRFLTECTRDWQCCTNRCKKGRCQLGQRGQMCTNGLYSSCDGKLICANNTEAGDIGTCADCFAAGADCKVDNVCCSGLCKEGKCS